MDDLTHTIGKPIRIGVDFGQVNNPSTIALAELTPVHLGRQKIVRQVKSFFTMLGKRTLDEDVSVPVSDTSYEYPLIEQVPLGTAYRDVARRIVEIACTPRLVTREVSIYCDQTGVGRPITEMLIDELGQTRRGERISVFPITFVAGETYSASRGTMGKSYLASRLVILMEQRLLHFPPNSPFAEALKSELRTFSRRMNANQHTQYGAFNEGELDDLVIAVGLTTLSDAGAGDLELLDPELAEKIQYFRGF